MVHLEWPTIKLWTFLKKIFKYHQFERIWIKQERQQMVVSAYWDFGCGFFCLDGKCSNHWATEINFISYLILITPMWSVLPIFATPNFSFPNTKIIEVLMHMRMSPNKKHITGLATVVLRQNNMLILLLIYPECKISRQNYVTQKRKIK